MEDLVMLHSPNDHITTGDITSRNINSSGIITATSFVGQMEQI